MIPGRRSEASDEVSRSTVDTTTAAIAPTALARRFTSTLTSSRRQPSNRVIRVRSSTTTDRRTASRPLGRTCEIEPSRRRACRDARCSATSVSWTRSTRHGDVIQRAHFPYGRYVCACDATNLRLEHGRRPAVAWSVMVDNMCAFAGARRASRRTVLWVRGTVNVAYTASDADQRHSTSVGAAVRPAAGGGVNWVDATTAGAIPPVEHGRRCGDGTTRLQVVVDEREGNQSDSSRVSVTVDGRQHGTERLPVSSATAPQDRLDSSAQMAILSAFATAPTDVGVRVGRVELQVQRASVRDVRVSRTITSGVQSRSGMDADRSPTTASCNFRLVATDLAGNSAAQRAANEHHRRSTASAPDAPSLFRIDRTITSGPPILTWTASPSGDIVGYKLVRDTVHLQGGGGLLVPADTDVHRHGPRPRRIGRRCARLRAVRQRRRQ